MIFNRAEWKGARLAALLAVLSMIGLSACAGGGGGSDLVGGPNASPPAPAPPPAPPPPKPLVANFTSWPEVAASSSVRLTGISTASPGETTLELSFDSARKPEGVIYQSSGFSYELRANGGPEMGFGYIKTQAPMGTVWGGVDDWHTFTASGAFLAGWSYQTFGFWYLAPDYPKDYQEAYSAGTVSPFAAIPVSGSAIFNGSLLVPSGPYAVGAADMTLKVDFLARSALFASKDWADQDRTYAGTALTGALSIDASQNRLSGTLTTANGALSGPTTGRFYGPQAEEVGGVFTLNPTGSTGGVVTGAFGARR